MDCTTIGNWGFAEITAIAVGIGMLLYALLLTVGCVRGIRAEQKEAEPQELQSN